MFPSSSDELDPTGTTSPSVGSSDSPVTLQSYARLALVAVLAWLAWVAFRDELGYVPLLSDIDFAALNVATPSHTLASSLANAYAVGYGIPT